MGATLPTLYQSRYSEAADYLGDRHFMITMFAAIALHLLGGVIWSIMPREEIVEVPVRTLNLKLGGGGSIASSATGSIDPAPSALDIPAVQDARPSPSDAPVAPGKAVVKIAQTVKAAVAKPLVAKPAPPKQPSKPAVRPATSQDAAMDAVQRAFQAKAKASVPVRYVREQGGDGKGQDLSGGSPYGNSLTGEQVQQRYTQMLSLWLDRRKIYPPEAQSLGLQGEATVRVRIDRAGNILQHYIERSSGYPMLDAAINRMVQDANPVPVVPERFPGGQQLEFLVPVSFKLR